MTTTTPPVVQIREYHAILTQAITADPTAVVLHNTYDGEIVWTRTSPGQFVGTLNGKLTGLKTGISVSGGNQDGIMSGYDNEDNSSVTLVQYSTTTNSKLDGLYQAYVIIRTYNI